MALAAPLALRPLLRRLGVVDVPNSRSSHSKPTLRGGGAAQLLALALFGTIGAWLLPEDHRSLGLLIMATGSAAGLVGLAEDTLGLTVRARLALQVSLGIGLAVGLGLLGDTRWVLLPVAVLFFAAYVNFANFMDGVNAISSLHGLTAGLSYSLLGLVTELEWLTFAGAIVATVFLAFLPWNLIPPGMFLGDSGSYLLGGTLAAVAITAYAMGVPMVAAVAPLSIYIADTVSTIIRRALRNEPLHEAHRTHAYQRLTDTGLSHIQVAIIVASFTFACGITAVLLVSGSLGATPSASLMVALLAAYLALPAIRNSTSTRLRRNNAQAN